MMCFFSCHCSPVGFKGFICFSQQESKALEGVKCGYGSLTLLLLSSTHLTVKNVPQRFAVGRFAAYNASQSFLEPVPVPFYFLI